MAEPKPIEQEFVAGVDSQGRLKGSQKSDRVRILEKRIDTLKDQLNGQIDKTNALKKTFQDQMDKMKAVNDKLQDDNRQLVDKHDQRLIKYMELSDRVDELESELEQYRNK